MASAKSVVAGALSLSPRLVSSFFSLSEPFVTMRCLSLFSALPLAVLALPKGSVPRNSIGRLATTEIPINSFDTFDTYWNYNYPWGTDHNGGARMARAQVSTAKNILTLTASPASGQKPATSGGTYIPIHYLSGTVHAKKTFAVQPNGGYDISAVFKAPVAKGTWPAFWLTAVQSWPPEIDIAEWKGDGLISFNAFNTSSEVVSDNVDYPDPDQWHTILAQIRPSSATDVSVNFYMDGNLVTTQYGSNYIGAAMYLIIDLQMEGSSGAPGPADGAVCQVSNVKILSLNP